VNVYDTIGLIELTSIAAGMKVLDEMAKRADFEILEAMPVCPGKYLILVGGEQADIEFAMERGLELSGEMILGTVLIPALHEQVVPALLREDGSLGGAESIGILETSNIAATIQAADASAKEAEVSILKIRVSRELRGKGLTVLCGDLSAIEAAVERGRQVAEDAGAEVQAVVIAQPHPVMEAEVFLTESRPQLYLGLS
jgi:microcompartment protein CcmL/EutN